MTKVAFPTDEHYPFQDEDARSIALQIVRDFHPDVLISGSDGLDFYAVSDFDKNPARVKVSLQDEIDGWKTGQREWNEAAPKARKVYIPGNHEDRLRRYLWRHPELASLEAMKLDVVLGFGSLGIEWRDTGKPYDQYELVVEGALVIRHGKYVRKNSAYSARAEMEQEKFAISGISGHTHRGASYYARTRRGMVQWHEGFCLCQLEPEYARHPDWQHGIALAEVIDGMPAVEMIAFTGDGNRKRAYWRGKEYRP